MAAKRKNLFLYLALACFLGIILIFIFDGYIGVYDRLVMDTGQYLQTIESDQWAQTDRFAGVFSVSIERGGRVDFTYTVENHRFSEYRADIGITLWQNKAQIGDIGFIPDEPLIIPAFGKKELAWSINAAGIIPAGYPVEQNYIVNVKINRGDIVREVSVYIQASPTIIKTVPAPEVPTR
jgi:hypothetical protein